MNNSPGIESYLFPSLLQSSVPTDFIGFSKKEEEKNTGLNISS